MIPWFIKLVHMNTYWITLALDRLQIIYDRVDPLAFS